MLDSGSFKLKAQLR